MQVLGAIIATAAVVVDCIVIASMGLVVFAPMRPRDRLTVFFAAPFAGLLAAGAAVIGYTMMGYGDLPPGTGGRVFRSVAILWGLGIVFGIFARMTEDKSPPVAATKIRPEAMPGERRADPSHSTRLPVLR